MFLKFIQMQFICLVVVLVSSQSYPFEPKIVFLDIGQGDSVLILPEEGVQILVDGGPGSQVLNGLGKYVPAWDRKIEFLVLTHPHVDHLNGLLEVMERYEVGSILYNPPCDFDLALPERNLNGKGFVGSSSKGEDWVLDIVYPSFSTSLSCDEVANINNASIILNFKYEGTNFLLMGDAEKELEKKLLRSNLLFDVDVLKAGHHCSKTSSSEEFLNVVKPELAICSVGENNRYGHPSPEVIERFERMGIKYLLTSESGDVVIDL